MSHKKRSCHPRLHRVYLPIITRGTYPSRTQPIRIVTTGYVIFPTFAFFFEELSLFISFYLSLSSFSWSLINTFFQGLLLSLSLYLSLSLCPISSSLCLSIYEFLVSHQVQMLTQKENIVKLKRHSKWVKANNSFRMYYRNDYDATNWIQLKDQLLKDPTYFSAAGM